MPVTGTRMEKNVVADGTRGEFRDFVYISIRVYLEFSFITIIY